MWFEEDGFFRQRELRALGVRHGVTTRALGGMKDPAARSKALQSAKVPEPMFRMVQQVHGVRVLRWEEAGPPRVPEADGLAADRPDAGIGVYVADCAPLFLWEKSGGVLSVGHMGWRGAAEGLARGMVEAMIMNYGVDPRDLRAAVGPHIRSCCFPVGPEVAARFPSQAVERRGGEDKPRVHLSTAAAMQLREAGLSGKYIDLSGPCTGCGADKFFSFRREKADNRMLAFAVHG